MAKKFNLAELMGGVSNLDTPQAGEKIVSNLDTIAIREIPLDQIDANAQNFYVVEDVSDLAESIQLVGLQQPLVVLPVDGRYRLIAGHRRYKALTELGKATAPCLIRTGLTDTEEQLALILTNSTARELTYPEKIEQAKRLKELYIKRREEGAELPGRIRDMVAAAMDESAAGIARMEAIDKHLIPEWKEDLNAYDISQSAAYELSKLPEDVQHKLKAEYPKGTVIAAQIIKSAAQTAQDSDTIIRESDLEASERSDSEADEQYMQSAYRRAQLSLMRWARDPRWDDADQLHFAIKFFRDTTEPSRYNWSPSMQDLFELADMMQISIPELLGLASALPPCTSEWHKYPVDKPDDGETVLCQYGKKQSFLLMVYREGEFGQIVDKEFVAAPFDVHYWTRAYPGGD